MYIFTPGSIVRISDNPKCRHKLFVIQRNTRGLCGNEGPTEQQAFCYSSSCPTITWVTSANSAVLANHEELNALTQAIISRIEACMSRIRNNLIPMDSDAIAHEILDTRRLTGELAAIPPAIALLQKIST